MTEKTYVCPDCGRGFECKQGLAGHARWCDGGEERRQERRELFNRLAQEIGVVEEKQQNERGNERLIE